MRIFSEKIKKRLNEIRNNEVSSTSSKKRKLSRLILLADIILIIAIFIYINNREDTRENTSQSVTVQNVQYRVSAQVSERNLVITTTLQSIDNEKEISFNGYIADIFVSYNNKTVSQHVVGEKKDLLRLEKMSAQNFFVTEPVTKLLSEINGNTVSKERKRSLISFFDKGELVGIRVLFNNNENVELTLSVRVKE